MTQKEKELLLRDLSARLPYGVEVNYKEYTYDIRHWNMDKLQQVKAKLEEMKANYVLEHDEEEYPLHSNGYGMWWSGFFSCLKEITSITDSVEKEYAIKES